MVKKAVFNQLVWGVDSMHSYRVAKLTWMKRRARELEVQEEALRRTMHPDVKSIMGGKRILLMDEMLKSIGYEDHQLTKDLCEGLRITGNVDITGKFAVDFRPAQLEVEDLWRVAKASQADVAGKIPAHMRGDAMHDGITVAQHVWRSTKMEVEKGWLEGPFSKLQVEAKVGKLWTPSRRFGIVQGGKVRNIDDLSEFSVNLAYGTPEKLDLGGLDEVVSLASQWVRAVDASQQEVEAVLSDGTAMRGKLHDDFNTKKKRRLHGRCLDLKSAYKQLALRPSDQSNAVLVVLNPASGQLEYYVSKVLPFGATGAVMGFNRVARALRDMMQKILYLPVVNYFDDFPHVDMEASACKSQVVMEEFLAILGWKVSMEVKKRVPPADEFGVLGAIVSLRESMEGVIVVRNKPERLDELRSTNAEVRESGAFPPALAARIQGRLTYAEAQCSGRWLAPLLEPVKRRSLLPGSVKWLSEEIKVALDACEKMLATAPPRRISALNEEPPCIVFTDGAYEGVASCGAVIFSPRREQVLVFGFEVPDAIVSEWQCDGKQQVIAQAEMLPIAIVKRQLMGVLYGARVIYFIDNDGVKEALIKGTTASTASRKILVECVVRDSVNQSMSWYSRIASPSNIADGPSRLDFSEVRSLFDVQFVEVLLDYDEWGVIG